MAATQKKFKPNEYIFREGTHSSSIILIQKGTVSIRKRVNAEDVELARVYSNEVLGELSFFDRSNRSASACALTETEVVEIDFDSLDKMWNPVPDYLKTIIRAMAERLRRADDMIRRMRREMAVAGVELSDDEAPEDAKSESGPVSEGEDEGRTTG